MPGRCVLLITQCLFADFLGGRSGPLWIFHLASSHRLLCPQVQASHGQIDQLFATLHYRDILRTVCQLRNSRPRGQSVKSTVPVFKRYIKDVGVVTVPPVPGSNPVFLTR